MSGKAAPVAQGAMLMAYPADTWAAVYGATNRVPKTQVTPELTAARTLIEVALIAHRQFLGDATGPVALFVPHDLLLGLSNGLVHAGWQPTEGLSNVLDLTPTDEEDPE